MIVPPRRILTDVVLPTWRRGTHIMGMPHPAPNWTVEQVLALPDDGNRYEVVDGELLVTPAPMFRHQDAILALVRRLEPFVRSTGVGHLSISPADIEFDGSVGCRPGELAGRVEGQGSGSARNVEFLALRAGRDLGSGHGNPVRPLARGRLLKVHGEHVRPVRGRVRGGV